MVRQVRSALASASGVRVSFVRRLTPLAAVMARCDRSAAVMARLDRPAMV